MYRGASFVSERMKPMRIIRVILNKGECDEIQVWRHLADDKGTVKVYAWLKDHDFVLIMKEEGSELRILTAYHLDSQGSIDDMSECYSGRIKPIELNKKAPAEAGA